MTKWKIPSRQIQSWLLGSRSKMNAVQKFDYLLALDFEATCLKNEKIEPQEIIEFPCLKIETKCFNVVDQFHSYVKPVHHPRLSDFCVELTGILQETVEDQPEFPQVLERFNEWLGSCSNFAFVTCGDWDLKTMLPSQCKTSGVQLPDYAKRWINLKREHQKVHGQFPRSFHDIITANGLKFEGRPHSGIDDTRNIARIIKVLGSKGHVFSY